MSTIFALFLVVIVSSTAFGQDAETNCIPGRRYHDGCNSCFCSETGVLGCTRMECVSVDPKTGKVVSTPRKMVLVEDETA